MQPSLSYNTMIVASKSFCLYIHNSQSSRMRAVSQWFFSINQASQSVQRACLRSVNQLPALSQSACKQCKGQSRKLQLSSIVLRSVCFLPILLQVFLYGSTQGIPLIRSGSFRRGGQTRTDSLPSVKWINFHLSVFLGSTREMFWIHVVSLNWSIPSPLGS